MGSTFDIARELTALSHQLSAKRNHKYRGLKPDSYHRIRIALSTFAEDHGPNPMDECAVWPAKAHRAKAGASADSAEEMKDTPGVSPGRLHYDLCFVAFSQATDSTSSSKFLIS